MSHTQTSAQTQIRCFSQRRKELVKFIARYLNLLPIFAHLISSSNQRHFQMYTDMDSVFVSLILSPRFAKSSNVDAK